MTEDYVFTFSLLNSKWKVCNCEPGVQDVRGGLASTYKDCSLITGRCIIANLLPLLNNCKNFNLHGERGDWKFEILHARTPDRDVCR